MARMLEEPRHVVAFREPVSRTYSAYLQLLKIGWIDSRCSFESYVSQCLEHRSRGTDAARENRAFFSVTASCYGDFLPRFVDVFPDTWVTFAEVLREEPVDETTRIVTWLALDPAPCATFDYRQSNVTRPTRFRSLHTAALRLNRRLEPYWHRHSGLKVGLRRFYFGLNRAAEEPCGPSAAARQALNEVFSVSNAQLRETMSRLNTGPLPSWLTRT
jgi:hypothetical protein